MKTDSGAPDLETWKYFEDLLQLLTVDGMSSEEEDTSNIGGVTVTIFKVKLCPWRAPEIKTYLDIMDKTHKHPGLGSSLAKMTPRIPSNLEGTTLVKGLP